MNETIVKNAQTKNAYPYSDGLMRWNEEDGRYYITEQALKNFGVHVRARLGANDTIMADNVINSLLELATETTYDFIHEHSFDNSAQDYFIAKIPSLRNIIYKVLVRQAIYLYRVGDNRFSTDEALRRSYMYGGAEAALGVIVPELGTSILYSGGR